MGTRPPGGRRAQSPFWQTPTEFIKAVLSPYAGGSLLRALPCQTATQSFRGFTPPDGTPFFKGFARQKGPQSLRGAPSAMPHPQTIKARKHPSLRTGMFPCFNGSLPLWIHRISIVFPRHNANTLHHRCNHKYNLLCKPMSVEKAHQRGTGVLWRGYLSWMVMGSSAR